MMLKQHTHGQIKSVFAAIPCNFLLTKLNNLEQPFIENDETNAHQK